MAQRHVGAERDAESITSLETQLKNTQQALRDNAGGDTATPDR